MNSYSDVIRYINRGQPGQTATVTVKRSGEEKNVRVTFAATRQVFGGEQRYSSNGQQGQARDGERNASQASRQDNDQDRARYGSNYQQNQRGHQDFGQQDGELATERRGQSAEPSPPERDQSRSRKTAGAIAVVSSQRNMECWESTWNLNQAPRSCAKSGQAALLNRPGCDEVTRLSP